MQKVRFSHPLKDKYFEATLPCDTTFAEMIAMLIKNGFIAEKKGGYQCIIEDRLCKLSSPLKDFMPYPAPETVDIRVHGLLIILT